MANEKYIADKETLDLVKADTTEIKNKATNIIDKSNAIDNKSQTLINKVTDVQTKTNVTKGDVDVIKSDVAVIKNKISNLQSSSGSQQKYRPVWYNCDTTLTVNGKGIIYWMRNYYEYGVSFHDFIVDGQNIKVTGFSTNGYIFPLYIFFNNSVQISVEAYDGIQIYVGLV